MVKEQFCFFQNAETGSALRVNTPSNSSEEPDFHLWFGRPIKQIKNDNSRDQQDEGYANALTQHNYVSKQYSRQMLEGHYSITRGEGFFVLDKLFISPPGCNIIFISHSASSKIFISRF